ncbi:MAG: hypothetical protein GEU73_18010 [Chloroflexi bacterium]|nr:hypothetical protein [Chloroflexota bacterium]
MRLKVNHHVDVDNIEQVEVDVTESANPAAVGWRWTSPAGWTHEVVWLRDTTSLHFASQTEDGGRWSAPSPIRNDDYLPRKATLVEARRAAHAFIRG